MGIHEYHPGSMPDMAVDIVSAKLDHGRIDPEAYKQEHRDDLAVFVVDDPTYNVPAGVAAVASDRLKDDTLEITAHAVDPDAPHAEALHRALIGRCTKVAAYLGKRFIEIDTRDIEGVADLYERASFIESPTKPGVLVQDMSAREESGEKVAA